MTLWMVTVISKIEWCVGNNHKKQGKRHITFLKNLVIARKYETMQQNKEKYLNGSNKPLIYQGRHFVVLHGQWNKVLVWKRIKENLSWLQFPSSFRRKQSWNICISREMELLSNICHNHCYSKCVWLFWQFRIFKIIWHHITLRLDRVGTKSIFVEWMKKNSECTF